MNYTSNKKYYYVVKQGRKPGIYYNPEDYDKQINNFHHAKSDIFLTYKEAIEYLNENELTYHNSLCILL